MSVVFEIRESKIDSVKKKRSLGASDTNMDIVFTVLHSFSTSLAVQKTLLMFNLPCTVLVCKFFGTVL